MVGRYECICYGYRNAHYCTSPTASTACSTSCLAVPSDTVLFRFSSLCCHACHLPVEYPVQFWPLCSDPGFATLPSYSLSSPQRSAMVGAAKTNQAEAAATATSVALGSSRADRIVQRPNSVRSGVSSVCECADATNEAANAFRLIHWSLLD